MANSSAQQGIYTEQHSGKQTTMHVDTSSVLDVRGTLNVASGTLTLPGTLAKGYINLGPLIFSAHEMASAEKLTSGTSAPAYFWAGMLDTDTTPSIDTLSTADPIFRLQWVSANVDSIILPPIALPDDLSTAGGMTIDLFGEVVGTATAADAIQAFKINARMGVGDTEMGATHPNFTSTPSYKGITITSGNMSTDQLSIILTPQTHAARAINLYGGRISYTKKSS